MTTTPQGTNQRTARDEAITHIQAVRDAWWPTLLPVGVELDAIPADTLRRLADERRMTKAES